MTFVAYERVKPIYIHVCYQELLVANVHQTGNNDRQNYIKCTDADVQVRTPDDGQKGCPKHIVIPIKLEISASVDFIHKEVMNKF